MTNHRTCDGQVQVRPITVTSGSAYLTAYDGAIDVECSNDRCAWRSSIEDHTGILTLAQLTAEQQSHQEWIEAGERVRFGIPEVQDSGAPDRRRVFLDLKPVGWLIHPRITGGFTVMFDDSSKGVAWCSEISQVRAVVEGVEWAPEGVRRSAQMPR